MKMELLRFEKTNLIFLTIITLQKKENFMKKILLESFNIDELTEGVFVKDFKATYPNEDDVATSDYKDDAHSMLMDVYNELETHYDLEYCEKPNYGQMNFMFQDEQDNIYTVFFFQREENGEIISGIVVSKGDNYKKGIEIETFDDLYDLLENNFAVGKKQFQTTRTVH